MLSARESLLGDEQRSSHSSLLKELVAEIEEMRRTFVTQKRPSAPTDLSNTRNHSSSYGLDDLPQTPNKPHPKLPTLIFALLLLLLRSSCPPPLLHNRLYTLI